MNIATSTSSLEQSWNNKGQSNLWLDSFGAKVQMKLSFGASRVFFVLVWFAQLLLP